MATPEWQVERVRDYYQETTVESYVEGWARDSLGFHFGLADDDATSHVESLLATNAYLAQRAGITRGARVLDAGCGVGGSSIHLASNHGASVVGISLVQEQVNLAREFAAQRGVQDLVRFECMDMLDMAFPERSFDVVWSIESVCHVLDLHAFLTRALRLLDLGGRVVTIDLCKRSDADSTLEQSIVDGWALAPMRTPQEMVQAMRDAGLADVQYVDLTPRAMRSARTLQATAGHKLAALKLERALLGKQAPIYEGHYKAALAMTEGMHSGATNIGCFLGTRPG